MRLLCQSCSSHGIEEADIPAALHKVGATLGHLHFVDSNRRPAGNGTLDYKPIAATLEQIGYNDCASTRQCVARLDGLPRNRRLRCTRNFSEGLTLRLRVAAKRMKPATLGLAPSFGFGDRTGLAAPGHVAAMKEAGGNLGDLSATVDSRDGPHASHAAAGDGRSTRRHEVCRLERPHFSASMGSRRPRTWMQLRRSVFTFFTIDPSGFVDAHSDNYDVGTARAKFAPHWRAKSVGSMAIATKRFRCPAAQFEFDELTLLRAAVKYGRASMKR